MYPQILIFVNVDKAGGLRTKSTTSAGGRAVLHLLVVGLQRHSKLFLTFHIAIPVLHFCDTYFVFLNRLLHVLACFVFCDGRGNLHFDEC
jgi:hypothetical protein